MSLFRSNVVFCCFVGTKYVCAIDIFKKNGAPVNLKLLWWWYRYFRFFVSRKRAKTIDSHRNSVVNFRVSHTYTLNMLVRRSSAKINSKMSIQEHATLLLSGYIDRYVWFNKKGKLFIHVKRLWKNQNEKTVCLFENCVKSFGYVHKKSKRQQ